jgi:poly(A) polymerase
MAEPTIVARSQHTLSRRDVDPDALKVLYRLHEHNYVAYLVGGSVRDLLLKRRPKDFDIGTSAHPHQVKKLFRNCWIIGRRFRLAHVKDGNKTIEVATFRQHVAASDFAPDADAGIDGGDGAVIDTASEGGRTPRRRAEDHLIERDNTYGTPEEDAFRRDFTVNALFYDIGTFSIIDYVGGLQDLSARLIRCIGDPDVRFLEDPVRMLRAVVLAARLQFTIDEPVLDAISTHAHEIARSSPARLVEEFYKILRSGHAEEAFRQLRATGLLKEITPELAAAGDPLWQSVASVDRYRARFEGAPDSMTNAILAGTLLHPLGLVTRRRFSADALERRVELGMLPIARRDIERLQQIIALQPRLLDLEAPQRTHRGLLHRAILDEAITWLEIHGGRPDAVAYWRALQAEPIIAPEGTDGTAPAPYPRNRRRRRRRRGPARATGGS